MKAFLLLALLLTFIAAQQICLSQECKAQLDACDSSCVMAMGKCTFDCTLSSLGCLQQCLKGKDAAVALLQCSFNKCINL